MSEVHIKGLIRLGNDMIKDFKVKPMKGKIDRPGVKITFFDLLHVEGTGKILGYPEDTLWDAIAKWNSSLLTPAFQQCVGLVVITHENGTRSKFLQGESEKVINYELRNNDLIVICPRIMND